MGAILFALCRKKCSVWNICKHTRICLWEREGRFLFHGGEWFKTIHAFLCEIIWQKSRTKISRVLYDNAKMKPPGIVTKTTITVRHSLNEIAASNSTNRKLSHLGHISLKILKNENFSWEIYPIIAKWSSSKFADFHQFLCSRWIFVHFRLQSLNENFPSTVHTVIRKTIIWPFPGACFNVLDSYKWLYVLFCTYSYLEALCFKRFSSKAKHSC